MKREWLDIPAVRAYLDRRFLCRVETEERLVALTFDDGPHPRHTREVCDILARKGIPATFFVVGREVRRFPDILRFVAEAGHEIGNHTDHHVPLPLLPRSGIRRELAATGDLITRLTGRKAVYFRPPMGWFSDAAIAEVVRMGYKPVIGSIHPHDSRRPGAQAIFEHIRSRIGPGAIIILHDGGGRGRADRSQTVAAVDRITDELLALGYRFETVGSLADRSAAGAGVTPRRAGRERDSTRART
jgi:peptidoglycan/xylan/chitin deacetylase (PgdA/CDA1 family)